jgi:uncharacterized membrane protein
MIVKLQHWWQDARTSFWFVPALIVIGAVSLAVGLIAVDTSTDLNVDERWPLIFGSGASGSRGLLTAVASSMITVAGVVFSITIVALSLTSSQYTSRVLRNFMRDRRNQVVLGVFVGIFAYCLVVLRTIRGGDEIVFVPSMSVLGGLGLAFVGIGFLIYFIHHISISIQASSIIAAAAEETIVAIDHLFPDELGDSIDETITDSRLACLESMTWTDIKATKTGYIESVHGNALLDLAKKHECIIRMQRGIGEFVVAGSPLLSIAELNGPLEEATADLNTIFIISRHRTVDQDAGFGIRQIVDISLKALSPGVNDTTTAVMCVDYLAAILSKLANRGTASDYRLDEGKLRVIARGPCFESLLAEAFDQIRQNAESNVAVLARQLQALEIIACQTTQRQRRQALRIHAELINEVAARTIPSAYDKAVVTAAFVRLAKLFDDRQLENKSTVEALQYN